MDRKFVVGQRAEWDFRAGVRLRGMPVEYGRGPFKVLDVRGFHAEVDPSTGEHLSPEVKVQASGGRMIWLSAELLKPVSPVREAADSAKRS